MTGCAGPTLLEDQWPAATPPRIELTATPFYPQTDYQCGPAALATLLSAAGQRVTPETLVGEVYVPARKGSLQPEMVAAARQRGVVVYPLRPELADLLAQLTAGHPVLVLQNLGLNHLPVWHYAVVIGADEDTETVLLRSGTERRRVEASDDFLRRWSLAGYWGIVALAPGELPANPHWPSYLSAVADLETTGAPELAGRAYAAALDRDPGLGAARLGLANVRYASGRLDEAAGLYESLAMDPDFATAALNNLANLRADQGCLDQARAALDQARVAAGPDSRFTAVLDSTGARLTDLASEDFRCVDAPP